MIKVLVTGSSGFIGKHLVATLLARGYSVCAIDKQPTGLQHSSLTNHIVDLLDLAEIRSAISSLSPDCVCHLAARTDLDEKNNISGYATNTDGVTNLIHAVRNTSSVQRCIFTSSQLVCRVGYVPKHEKDYCPNTLYGQSKVLTEKIVRENDGGVAEWCLVRPTTVWGPGMSTHYQHFLRMIQQRRYFHVGKRALHKSYSYVGNITHQYIKLLEAPTEQINRKTLYLADYTPISLREWANAFQREFDVKPIPTFPEFLARLAAKLGDSFNTVGFKRFPFNSFRLNNVLTEYQFDLRDTEQVCGPLPYTMEEGVKETSEWFLSLGAS